MRIKNKSNFWWVWSPEGPSDSTIRFDRQFINGILPFPVPGDIAAEMEYQSFGVKEWVPGEEFTGWEKSGYQWLPTFSEPVDDVPGVLPPIDGVEALPDFLPDAYIDLFEKYTAKGKMKSKYR